MPLNCDKALPELPAQVIYAGNGSDGNLAPPPPASESASDPNKTLAVINIENRFSAEEMDRLHDLWNETSAHVHRRRHRQQKPLPPSSICVPETGNILVGASSAPTMAPTTSGSQRLRDFFSARTPSDASKADAKASNALQSIRSKAQRRLMNKLKCAKSTPNLSGKATVAVKAEARIAPLPPKLASMIREGDSKVEPKQEAGPLEELDINVNDGGIYLTLDPEWCTSSGDVLLTFITPIPQDPLARPDSPLLHRHRSLCELTTHFQFPERDGELSNKQSLHPIDELHSYLEM